MKKYLVGLISLLGCVGVSYAQVDSDAWRVFEPASGQETTEQVSNLVAASVVGRDDRREITGKANNWERAVVVLEMQVNGQRALCSGSMVAPNVVLTAAHCLHSRGKFMEQVEVFAVGMPPSGTSDPEQEPQPPLVPPPSRVQPPAAPKQPSTQPQDVSDILNKLPGSKKTPRVTLPRDIISRLTNPQPQMSAQDVPVQGGIFDDFIGRMRQGGYPSAVARKLWVPQEWIRLTRGNRDGTVNVDREEKYDYGILVLERPLGERTGWLGLTVKSSQQLRNASILVVGRGGDKPARSLWKGTGRVGRVYGSYFFHNADQVGGNSGGPIFDANDQRNVIALANFGDARQQVSDGFPNGGLRITQSIVNAVSQAK